MSVRPSSFADFVSQSPFVVLAGAMGTELQRRGYKTKLPLWSAQANLDALDLVTQIHTDYLDAGADVCITNTFRTADWTFKKLGRESEAHEALCQAVAAARKAHQAFSRLTFIGGSFAPLEDCYRPDLVPDDSSLKREHFRQAKRLADEGVDFLLPETINAINEARIMAEAAAATGLPFIISFVVDSEGRLLDGTSLEKVVSETNFPGRVGVSLNCRPIDVINQAFNKLSDIYSGPIGLYPNGFGQPHDDLGWLFEQNQDGVDKFVSIALHWYNKGAKIIGGCCGTTPDYIRGLAVARERYLTENLSLQRTGRA